MSNNGNNQRYGKNRNIWRKVYSYGKQKPKIVTFVDNDTSRSLTFDLNQTYRHRDYFIVDKKNLQPTSSLNYAEYDEGLIWFNNESFKTGSYNFVFSGKPYVVFSIESTENSASNINVFGLNLPVSSSFVVGVSAPFSGAIRYRAVYSNNIPAYPSHVVHNPLWFQPGKRKDNSPYTSSFIVYGGAINTTHQINYTASFEMPSASFFEYRATAHDVAGDMSADVFLEQQSLSISQSINTISSELSNRIHFIVTAHE